MMCDVSGKVTFVEKKATKEGTVFVVVKVMQSDKVGNVATIPVRVWDSGLISKGFVVGDDVLLDDVKVVAYKSGIDRVGLSVDKW